MNNQEKIYEKNSEKKRIIIFCFFKKKGYNEKKEKIEIKKISKPQIGILTLTFVLFLSLIGSNYLWYRIHKKEENKLTHALIPPFTEDYYLNAMTLTKQKKKSGEIEYKSQNFQENFWKEEVNLINQNPDYPNGCEAATAVMLLNHYNMNISLNEFITDYLKKEKVYELNQKRYGPNPATTYAGDPSSKTRGWGCFEPVIEISMKKVMETKYKNLTKKIHIEMNQNKESLNTLSSLSIPIMIWTTIDYQEVSEVYEWFSYDSKFTYTYPKNSHAVLMTGVDEFYYYINDPLKKEKNIKVKKQELENSFDSMGRQAIYLNLK